MTHRKFYLLRSLIYLWAVVSIGFAAWKFFAWLQPGPQEAHAWTGERFRQLVSSGGFAIYATCIAIIFSRLKFREPNQCLQCGYDLRASADRCPECGERVPPPNNSKSNPS